MAILLLFASLVVSARWNAHLARLEILRREETQAARLVAAFNADLLAMHSAGKSYTDEYTAMNSAIRNTDENFLGQVGVAKRYADIILNDASFDKVIAQASRDVPQGDAVFGKDAAAMQGGERKMRDNVAAFSTSLGAVLSNPLMANAISGAEWHDMGFNIGRGIRDLGRSWTALEHRVGQLRDAARVKQTALESEFGKAHDRNPAVSVLSP